MSLSRNGKSYLVLIIGNKFPVKEHRDILLKKLSLKK